MLGLIWVQTVCKGYQQMTLGDKELSLYSTRLYCHSRPSSASNVCISIALIAKVMNPDQTASNQIRERSGSLIECLTRDRVAAGSSLTGITVLCPSARHNNPSLVLVQPRKTHPYVSERLLMGRKESNQTNKTSNVCTLIALIKKKHTNFFKPFLAQLN